MCAKREERGMRRGEKDRERGREREREREREGEGGGGEREVRDRVGCVGTCRPSLSGDVRM